MKPFERITMDPDVMGGKACIRGLRVTVGTIVGLLAAGRSPGEILKAYPYLEREDIDQSLAYAAWRLEEREVPLARPRCLDLSLLGGLRDKIDPNAEPFDIRKFRDQREQGHGPAERPGRH